MTFPSLGFSSVIPNLLLKATDTAVIINNKHYYLLLIVIHPKPEGIKEFPSGISRVMMC